MTINTIITILVIIVALVGLGITAYLYFKEKKLSEIRADVYQLFLEAEHKYTETKQGKQKLKWVVSRARGLLPDWLQVFITETALEKMIDIWFKAVKDLLDDGKYNKSVKR